MDAAPSFGDSMISEVPSNPQLTLGIISIAFKGKQVAFYIPT